jgi:hypothetical protein
VKPPGVEPIPGVDELLPDDPYEAHKLLMQWVAELDRDALQLEQAFEATDDPERQQDIRQAGIATMAARTVLMEKAAGLLLEVAPTPAFAELAHVLRGQARADRQQWDTAARAHARTSRAPALMPVLLHRARTTAREARPRRRDGQRATGERSPPRRSPDPDDDPHDVDPPAEAAA